MALVKAEIKRAMLNCIYRGSTVAGLSAGLVAFQDQGFAAMKSGRVLIATSAAGHSSTFKIPMPGDAVSQDEFFGFSQELLETFDTAKAVLISEGNATPTDAQILARMLVADNMQAITRYQTDYVGIRFPSVGGTTI